MRTLISAPTASGHLAVLRLPEGARFTAAYIDDPEGEERDITELVADLLVIGALDAAEVKASDRPAPAESVVVAVVSYTEPLLPGQVRATSTFTWVHVPTREGGDFDPREVLSLIARGIAVSTTAGVAHEAGDVPDDASDLEGDTPAKDPAAS